MPSPGPPRVLFPEPFDKPVVTQFDTEGLTSDGGVLLLGALDRAIGLTDAALSKLVDQRATNRVTHGLGDMLRQRVLGLVLGYEDCNDSARIKHDPAVKITVGRGLDDADLASGSTLCRFENSVTACEVVESGRATTAWRLTALRKRFKKARTITIDLDSTPDPTHGQQQFTFFDAHCDCYSYKPLVVALSFDDDPEEYVVAVRLRPGKSPDNRTVPRTLRRLVSNIRRLWRKSRIRVRADAGFGKSPRLLDVLDELRVQYVLGYQPTKTLNEAAQPWQRQAQALHDQGVRGEDAQVYGEFCWKPTTRTWRYERRLVVKAEVTETDGREPRLNTRFVVSNRMGRFKPKALYRVYRQRGDSENRIKELKQLNVDRTSCSRFVANAFRVLLATVAYMLVQELRWRLRRTELRRAQVETFRVRLFKMAARVVESVRRIVLHCPIDFPWADQWRQAALAVGAAPG